MNDGYVDGRSSFGKIADRIEELFIKTGKKKEKKMTDINWAVVNRETGNIAYTRESGYNSKALFKTRDEARKALREGRVYAAPQKGRVVKKSN